mgnify:CR=1 FL=1
MKQEEFMESIYGCLERIENKINGLSMPQSAGGDAEADSSASEVTLQEVIQELNALKTGFKRVLEALVMIKGDTANLQKRNSMAMFIPATTLFFRSISCSPKQRKTPSCTYRRRWNRFPLPSGTGWRNPMLSVTDTVSA